MQVMKYLLRLIVAAFVMAFLFVSCEDDESWERPSDMKLYIPDYCIAILGSRSVSGSMASFNLEPRVHADFDFWQLKIVSIDYYIDEELIETDLQEPYAFVYTAEGLSKGIHKLILKVKINDMVSGEDIVISPTIEFEIK